MPYASNTLENGRFTTSQKSVIAGISANGESTTSETSMAGTYVNEPAVSDVGSVPVSELFNTCRYLHGRRAFQVHIRACKQYSKQQTMAPIYCSV